MIWATFFFGGLACQPYEHGHVEAVVYSEYKVKCGRRIHREERGRDLAPNKFKLGGANSLTARPSPKVIQAYQYGIFRAHKGTSAKYDS